LAFVITGLYIYQKKKKKNLWQYKWILHNDNVPSHAEHSAKQFLGKETNTTA
jgi:hypothetical protein